MNDKTQQKERKKFNAHSFLHFYRNRVMNILLIIIGILYFICRMSYVVPNEMEHCYDQLLQNIRQAQMYQEYANSADELYVSNQDQEYISDCNIFIGYINSGYTAQAVIDRINSISDDYNAVFYLKSDGTLISHSDRSPLSLTEEDMAQLLSDGVLVKDGDPVRYWALPNNGDYMIVRTDETYANHITMDVKSPLYLDSFIFDDKTLDVTEKDEDIIPSNVGSMYVGEPKEVEQFADSQAYVVMISPNKSGISKYTDMKLAAICPLDYQNEGRSICAYISVSEIIGDILVKSGLPAFLCFGFIALCVFGSLHLRHVLLKEKEENGKKEKSKKVISLPFNCYIRVDLTRCILFMQFFMGILVVFCSVILLSLSRFSASYADTKYSLEQLSVIEKSCQEALKTCKDAYISPAVGMAQTVNNFYLIRGDVTVDQDIQDDINRMVEATYLDEISVYDEEGNNVYTTADTVGYPLSTDPSSPEYSFWNLLSGDQEYVLTESDSGDGAIYCAMRRSDKIGIIVLTFSDKGFEELEKQLSSESIIYNCNYSDSCLFVDAASDSSSGSANSAYQISNDGTKVSCAVSDLSALSYKETFCGFRKYNNQQCLMVGLGGETRTTFYFVPVSEIISGLGASIASYIFFLILICLLDFIGTGIFTEETIQPKTDVPESGQNKKASHNLTRKMIKRLTLSNQMEDSQKIIWQRGLYSTIILLAITFILDMLLNDRPMLTFLFGDYWEKGVNLFAFTEIVLVILASCLLFKLLRFLFDELSKNFSLHYTTVIQMLHSILNIVIVLVIALFCANKLGINTSTILASVGISGLALGIAAKDTINDMLNGLFIILDHRIQVGDWVQVGDFYGEVEKIGIRTTKVNYHNSEKSINNSDMKNLTNLSKGVSGVYLKFYLAYDTDLDYLKQLLRDSFDRFQEVCNGGLTGGVKLLVSDGFHSKAITASVFIPCDEKNRKSFSHKCNPVLISILKENNIEAGTIN